MMHLPHVIILLLGPFSPCLNKAEFAEEGAFFREPIPSLGNFINKKVGIRKN
jgi:hypothetical protein